MKFAAKILVWCSALLLVASLATCHFGVEHEINKIPPERRAGMSDFDWIGVEWIMLSMAIMAGAVLFATASLVLWFLQRRQRKRAEKAA